MCRWRLFTSLFGIRNTGSSNVTSQSSSFKVESGFGLGVLGEEVYVGLGVDWEGMCGEYLPEGSNVGNSRGLLESEFVIHTKVVDFGHLHSFYYYSFWP